MHVLFDPWTHAFMQRALGELVLLGVVGAVVGCWIVLYELAYSAESLAHALLPGAVGAALLGIPLVVGGAVGVLAAAAAMALVGRVPLLRGDTSVAVVITSLFGLGVLVALSPSTPPGVDGILFGDLLGVTNGDLLTSGLLAAGSLVALTALYRPLLATGFERSTASAFGLSPALVDLALLGLLAVAIVIGVQALGNLLVVALLVGPAACARLLTHRMARMMLVAAVVAVVAALGGLYLSYYAGLAAGASVAAVMVGGYLTLLAVTSTSRAVGTRL
jgi:ABC-type Mn2+/Zn2+ transport system permease subunit